MRFGKEIAPTFAQTSSPLHKIDYIILLNSFSTKSVKTMKIKSIFKINRSCLLLTMGLATIGLNAQEVRWGVNAGMNINMPADCDTRVGFLAGVKGEACFNQGQRGWFTDYALNFSYIPFSEYNGAHTANPYYLNITVNAGYRFTLSDDIKLSVTGGLFGNIGLFGKGKTTYTGTKVTTDLFDKHEEDFNRFNWGAAVTTGIEFKSHYQLSVCYGHGFNDASKTGFNFINNLSVAVGYMF